MESISESSVSCWRFFDRTDSLEEDAEIAIKALGIHYTYKMSENHGLRPLPPPRIIRVIISGCPPWKEVWYGFASVTNSVQSLSRVRLFATPWLQHARALCPSLTPRAYSNSCPLSQWCHPTISSSVIPFSCHLQSFPASRSLPMSQFFTWDGQNIGAAASASVLPTDFHSQGVAKVSFLSLCSFFIY